MQQDVTITPVMVYGAWLPYTMDLEEKVYKHAGLLKMRVVRDISRWITSTGTGTHCVVYFSRMPLREGMTAEDIVSYVAGDEYKKQREAFLEVTGVAPYFYVFNVASDDPIFTQRS